MSLKARNNWIAVIVVIVSLVFFSVLFTGCASTPLDNGTAPEGGTNPGESSDVEEPNRSDLGHLYEESITLSDGRTIPCIVYPGQGFECDWEGDLNG